MLTGLLLTTLFAAQAPSEPVLAKTARRVELSTDFGKSAEVITKLPRGARVQLLLQNGASLQARAREGVVGWLEIDDLEVKRIVPRKERSLWGAVKGWRGRDLVRKVGPQDTLTVLGYAEGRKWFHVKTEQGDKGYLHIQSAGPDFAVGLEEYDHRGATYWREDRLREAVVGRPVQEVEAQFGAPLSKQLTDEAGFLFYRSVHFVRDGDVHSYLRMPVEGGKVTDLVPKRQTSAWVESLPLAHTLRGLDVGLALQRVGSLPLMDTTGVQGWRWWAQNALKLAIVILLLLVPHYIASFLTTRLGYVRPLPNLVVSLVGLLLCVSAFYVYFLFLSLHGLHEDHIVLALPLLFVLAFSAKIVTGRVAYHRCPECHAMFSASDEGSAVVGKTHVTTEHSKFISRGKREGFKSTTLLYDEHRWKERETRMQVQDHRACRECGYEWDVEREETVKGHV